MEKKTKTVLKIVIPTVSVLAVAGICLGYLCPYSKAVDVDEYFKSSAIVKVTEEKNQYLFDGPGSDDLFVFYPGGKVDEKAYAPLLYRLAAAGLDCYLTKMPFHLAVFSPKKADKVIKNHEYKNYYVGGHSLGGAMSAYYAKKTKNDIKGLIFLAAYSAYDLTDKTNLNIISIYGSNDGVLEMDKVEKGRGYMPESYAESVIEGGNHAQFGSYGKQKGDNDASISAETQWNLTVTAVTAWLAAIK